MDAFDGCGVYNQAEAGRRDQAAAFPAKRPIPGRELDAPTLAECCLIPQMYDAWRSGCEMRRIPTLRAIEKRCKVLPAFSRAAPDAQPDAP